jgi:dUTP pyrophosphatase|tara:strand:+ start:43 stop:498 length:456 start_codon:yes stop_codon:yes gene_type:complete
MIVEYHRIAKTVPRPSRANPSDAGLDIRAHIQEEIEIDPGESAIIPTGLRFGIPHGFMLQVMNRSSIAAKKSLIVGAHVVDAGYDGEVFVNLHNVGSETQIVKNGQKIAQLVMVPVIHFRAFEEHDGILYDSREPICISDRGDGALGSTGG